MGPLLLMVAGLLAPVQDARREPKREEILRKVDRRLVDRAIALGVKNLSDHVDQGTTGTVSHFDISWRFDDIILLTFIHAGLPHDAPAFRKVLKTVLETPVDHTYYASLQAMALLKLDKAAYQWRIAQCAQMLLDNQADDGGWRYGKAVNQDHLPPTKPKAGTAALRRISLKRRERTEKDSDSSNSQYAAMGLRAAHEAEISLPFESLKEAANYWDRLQKEDGSWSYKSGWPKQGYGAMTAGGMASLSSLVYMMGSAPRLDPRLARARRWISDNWSVTEEPLPKGKPPTAHTLHYYLYSVERAGTLFGTEIFGTHEWYIEGARSILESQRADGGWGERTSDTCFAILFLRRATDDFRPPVATEDTKR